MIFHSEWREIRRRDITRILLAVLASAIIVAGCERASKETGAYPVASNADCLPDVTLIDQDGHDVSLASLKGKPVLFDFIYTTCPGPCLALTAQMKAVARQLGASLGTKVRFVSISVDPEHDRPPQLLKYAKAQGADLNGWLFLTGTPEQIDQFMARFKLRRQREPNGSIDHVLEFFLVGADGHPLLQYLAARADPAKIAGDLERAASGGQVVGSAGSGGSRRHSRAAA
jgi:protein SCO1